MGSSESAAGALRVADVDTHIIEPPDLWTARLPSKWRDMCPQTRWVPEAQTEAWYVGSRRIADVGTSAMAGWGEYPPNHPRTWADIDPDLWDAGRRLAMMDEYGISAEVLYPNLLLFYTDMLETVTERDLWIDCIRAYNDFLAEWAGADRNRLIPVMLLPFWDLEASLAEVERSSALGHRGVIFTQDPRQFGLPGLADTHWDPLWRSLENRKLPVNFHIGSAGIEPPPPPSDQIRPQAAYAAMGVTFFMSNARTIATLTCGGVCHRFPTLSFVSVESGVGWLPYALSALDWQWKNCGVGRENPEYELLPSEYFQRQIYGCFWFEDQTIEHTVAAIGAGNLLYETDYPHPTSMSPGPASAAVRPDQYIASSLSVLSPDDKDKVLFSNAARLYQLTV